MGNSPCCNCHTQPGLCAPGGSPASPFPEPLQGGHPLPPPSLLCVCWEPRETPGFDVPPAEAGLCRHRKQPCLSKGFAARPLDRSLATAFPSFFPSLPFPLHASACEGTPAGWAPGGCGQGGGGQVVKGGLLSGHRCRLGDRGWAPGTAGPSGKLSSSLTKGAWQDSPETVAGWGQGRRALGLLTGSGSSNEHKTTPACIDNFLCPGQTEPFGSRLPLGLPLLPAKASFCLALAGGGGVAATACTRPPRGAGCSPQLASAVAQAVIPAAISRTAGASDCPRAVLSD